MNFSPQAFVTRKTQSLTLSLVREKWNRRGVPFESMQSLIVGADSLTVGADVLRVAIRANATVSKMAKPTVTKGCRSLWNIFTVCGGFTVRRKFLCKEHCWVIWIKPRVHKHRASGCDWIVCRYFHQRPSLPRTRVRLAASNACTSSEFARIT